LIFRKITLCYRTPGLLRSNGLMLQIQLHNGRMGWFDIAEIASVLFAGAPRLTVRLHDSKVLTHMTRLSSTVPDLHRHSTGFSASLTMQRARIEEECETEECVQGFARPRSAESLLRWPN
jgi:hypothetical protein